MQTCVHDLYSIIDRFLKNGPATHSATCSSSHVSDCDCGRGHPQRFGLAGWEEEDDGGVHCLQHL